MREEFRSEFIDLLMPNASEAERIDATRRWFNVLSILIRMAENHSCPRCDSHESQADDRVADMAKDA